MLLREYNERGFPEFTDAQWEEIARDVFDFDLDYDEIFGAEAAAPIARRVLDYLLAGQYPSEEDIALVREGKAAAPVGTPRPIREWRLPNEAPLPASGASR